MSISNAKPEHPVPSAVIGRVQLLAVAIAAALLQAFVINQLVARGIVEKIIPWDECGYIYSAINNVVSIKQGIWHGLQYAHSPLAMFPLTLVTYLFPQSSTAPYVTNLIYTTLVFFFIYGQLKRYGFLSVITFLVVFVTTPFMFLFSSHVKTDFHGGILFFVLLVYLFRDAIPDKSERQGIWVPAALSVLIFLSKPAALYLPGLLFAAFLASTVVQMMDAKVLEFRKRIVRRQLISFGIAVGVYALLIALNFDYFKSYFLNAVSPTWAGHLSLADRLSYYLPFGQAKAPGNESFWGYGAVAAAMVSGCFLVAISNSPERKRVGIRASALFLVAVVGYVPIVMSPQLNFSFGALFAGAVMALLFHMYCSVQRNFARPLLMNVVILVGAIVSFQIPVWSPRGFPDNDQPVNEAHAIVTDFVSRMAPNVPEAPVRRAIFLPFAGSIPGFDFAIKYYRQYQAPPPAVVESFEVDQSIVNRGLSWFGYVIMLGDGQKAPGSWEPDGRKIPSRWESNRNLGRYQEMISGSWNLQELSRLPFDGTHYILYRVVSRK